MTIPADVTAAFWIFVVVTLGALGALSAAFLKYAASNFTTNSKLNELETRQKQFVQDQAERATQLSDRLSGVLTELKLANDAKSVLGERVAKVEADNSSLKTQVDADQRLSSDQQKEIGSLKGTLLTAHDERAKMEARIVILETANQIVSKTNAELRDEKIAEIKAHAETRKTLENERAEWAVRETLMTQKIDELTKRVIDQDALIRQMSARLDYLEKKVPFKEFIEQTDPDPVPPQVVLNIKAEASEGGR